MDESISLFISDIHLSESRSDLTAAFLHFLNHIAIHADHLYILGDLFDSWAGDDVETQLTQHIAQQLKELSNQGIHIYFQHGNRDFALGQQYADRAGLVLLPDYYPLPYAPAIIVMHGDQLCIFDKKYQRYRKIIRHPILLSLLRRLPKKYRIALANKIRSTSKEQLYTVEDRRLVIPDDAVSNVYQVYNASTIIHGHTHQPATHYYGERARWVLSDWDKSADYLSWQKSKGLVRHHIDI